MISRAFHLASAILFWCAVANGQWSPDVRLSTSGSSAMLNENMGRCLIAEGDTVHAVWSEGTNPALNPGAAVGGKDQAIVYKRSLDGGITWEPQHRVSPAGSADAFPLLGHSAGTLHLVFLRGFNTPQAASYYKRSTDGGLTWGPDVLLGQTKWWSGIAAVGPNIYVTLNTVFADDAHNSVVYFRRSADAGVTWSDPLQLSLGPRRTGGRSEDPALAADGDFVHTVWNDNREFPPGKGLAACYRRSRDRGATWDAETLLTHAPDNIYFPTVWTNGPHVDICYGDRRPSHFDIYYLHSGDNGATWDPPQQLTDTPGDEHYPSIVRDGARLHVVWSSKQGIHYLHSPDGGAHWEPAVSLADQGTFPFIAVAKNGVHVVFRSERDGHAAIYYRQNPTGNKSGAGDAK